MLHLLWQCPKNSLLLRLPLIDWMVDLAMHLFNEKEPQYIRKKTYTVTKARYSVLIVVTSLFTHCCGVLVSLT